MSHAIEVRSDSNRTHDRTVAAIARDTETAADLVKVLYDEEFAALESQARIKQFVNVIAIKRVKDTLRALESAH